MATGKHAVQVHRQRFVPGVFIKFIDRPPFPNPGIGYQYVEPAEFCCCSVEEAGNLVEPGYVSLKRNCAHTMSASFVYNPLGLRLMADVVHNHRSACLGQSERGSRSNSSRRAGNESNP